VARQTEDNGTDAACHGRNNGRLNLHLLGYRLLHSFFLLVLRTSCLVQIYGFVIISEILESDLLYDHKIKKTIVRIRSNYKICEMTIKLWICSRIINNFFFQICNSEFCPKDRKKINVACKGEKITSHDQEAPTLLLHDSTISPAQIRLAGPCRFNEPSARSQRPDIC
jgi:hypothetical protein